MAATATQREDPDYMNERPRPAGQRWSGEAPQNERKICLLLLISFGLLCITQAALNISLRLTLYSGEESIRSNCNTSQSGNQSQKVKVPQDCEQSKNNYCSTLQESFNDLSRLKKDRDNQISELRNTIRNMANEKRRLEELHRACQQCPAGWRRIKDRCYFLSNERRSWMESRKYCQREGSDLVVINSEEEQRALYRLNGDADLMFWIGLSQRAGNLRWVDGSVPTKVFWRPGPPDNGVGPAGRHRDDCVEMNHMHPVLASWNYSPCGPKKRWLCEKDPPGAVSP